MDKPLLNEDLAKLLLRLTVGGLMLLHGVHKVNHGVDGIEGLLEDHGWPTGMAYGIHVGEVLAPVLLILGFLTRVSGLIIAGTMGVSMYLAYGAEAFELTQHGGLATELNLLYLAGGLVLFLSGGGRYSVARGEGRWS